jgi:hypothetical protein
MCASNLDDKWTLLKIEDRGEKRDGFGAGKFHSKTNTLTLNSVTKNNSVVFGA